MTPEAKVKKNVREFLRAKGVWYFQPVSNGMGRVGIPDFVCCFKGRFIGIETKAPGKRNATTENQKRVMEEITQHGGTCIVVDDVVQLHDFFENLVWRL